MNAPITEMVYRVIYYLHVVEILTQWFASFLSQKSQSDSIDSLSKKLVVLSVCCHTLSHDDDSALLHGRNDSLYDDESYDSLWVFCVHAYLMTVPVSMKIQFQEWAS